MSCIRFFTGLLFMVIILSCHGEKYTTDIPSDGDLSIYFDDSFVNVIEALSYRYTKNYPKTSIKKEVMKEDQALQDFFNKKTKIILMSRELTDQERKIWDSNIKLDWNPAYFAADAVCFVVHKSSSLQSISIDEIREYLLSEEKRLIFDGRNSSNFNNVINTLALNVDGIKYSVIKGNENIINSLEKYPNHIGVIALNTISRPFGAKAQKLRELIRILPVKDQGKLYFPTKKMLKNKEYPFTKMLYFLTSEPYFGLANGFIRFSCTQRGQMIVDKQGLQPYYLFPRTVRIR